MGDARNRLRKYPRWQNLMTGAGVLSIFSKILSIVGSSNSIISAFSVKNFKYCRKLKTVAPDIFLKTCRGKNEKSIFEKK
jgi:hypothetical protein